MAHIDIYELDSILYKERFIMKFLWKPVATIIFVITLFLVVKHLVNQDLVLERTPHGEEKWSQFEQSKEHIAETVKENWIVSEFKKDTAHFVSIIKDLFSYSKTGESSYSSGIDAIFGDSSEDEDININLPTLDINIPDSSSLEEVTLVHVADGDTLTVVDANGNEYRVRLIGIDTPESVNPDKSKNNEYGKLASEHTKNILKNVTTLYLEYDEEITDAYGRILAYVWIRDNSSDMDDMLNAKILSDGYAVDKVYQPNDRYAEIFKNIKDKSKAQGIGLWAYEEYRNIIGG